MDLGDRERVLATITEWDDEEFRLAFGFDRTPEEEFIVGIEFDDEYEPEHHRHFQAHLFCPHCGAEDSIVEVDRAIRWNRFGEVELDREPRGDLPPGYRWANEYETEMHNQGRLPLAIVVKRTVDAQGKPYTQDEADIAVPDNQIAYAFASTGEGDFDHDGFLCTECQKTSLAPDYFSIADWN